MLATSPSRVPPRTARTPPVGKRCAGAMALLLLALTACREALLSDINVGIAPESTAGHVVFTIAPSPLMYGLAVLPCGKDRPMWEIAHDTGNSPVRIVYGELPPGYVVRVPAQPLRPGCYRVVVSGPSSAESSR